MLANLRKQLNTSKDIFKEVDGKIESFGWIQGQSFLLNSQSIINLMMIFNWQERTVLLFGEEEVKKFNQSQVLIVGIGSVAVYAAEQTVRTGVRQLSIVDGNRVSLSDKSCQLSVLTSTVRNRKF